MYLNECRDRDRTRRQLLLSQQTFLLKLAFDFIHGLGVLLDHVSYFLLQRGDRLLIVVLLFDVQRSFLVQSMVSRTKQEVSVLCRVHGLLTSPLILRVISSDVRRDCVGSPVDFDGPARASIDPSFSSGQPRVSSSVARSLLAAR